MFIEISQNSQEDTCARVTFLIKLQVSACNFIKKDTLTQLFSCEFFEISKSTFFTEHQWGTVFVCDLSLFKNSFFICYVSTNIFTNNPCSTQQPILIVVLIMKVDFSAKILFSAQQSYKNFYDIENREETMKFLMNCTRSWWAYYKTRNTGTRDMEHRISGGILMEHRNTGRTIGISQKSGRREYQHSNETTKQHQEILPIQSDDILSR